MFHLHRGNSYHLVSNGLAIQKNIAIDGKGATLVIDDAYNPLDVEGFCKRIIRNQFKNMNSLEMKNLNIDVNFSDNTYTDNYLCVMQPAYFKNVTLDNVNINIPTSKNRITAFWLDHGCDSLKVSNCDFTNNTTYQQGGIVFLTSYKDPIFNYFNEFKDVTFTNCNFVGTCGDEIIAIWGANSQNVVFDHCYVKWERDGNNNGRNRAIAIYGENDVNANFNVDFINSTFELNKENDGSTTDAFVGVGSAYVGNKFHVNFTDCNIDANISGSLIYPSLLGPNIEKVANFDFDNPSTRLKFTDSIIKCNRPITGNHKDFITNSPRILATDCSFDNCDIECVGAFAFLEHYSSTTHYYVPHIKLKDCSNIKITNPQGIFYRTSLSAIADIDIQNSHFIAEGITDFITSKYDTSSGSSIKQQNYEHYQVNTTGGTIN